MTDYPNREHANADKGARRRAIDVLSEIASEAGMLSTRLSCGDVVDAMRARTFADRAAKLAEELAILQTLCDVREWHAADEADRTAPVT